MIRSLHRKASFQDCLHTDIQVSWTLFPDIVRQCFHKTVDLSGQKLLHANQLDRPTCIMMHIIPVSFVRIYINLYYITYTIQFKLSDFPHPVSRLPCSWKNQFCKILRSLTLRKSLQTTSCLKVDQLVQLLVVSGCVCIYLRQLVYV